MGRVGLFPGFVLLLCPWVGGGPRLSPALGFAVLLPSLGYHSGLYFANSGAFLAQDFGFNQVQRKW